MLTKNALQGLSLVFLAMLIFFPFGFSFWVALGLPISFFLTFFFMKQIGLSINMLSMVGLLIGLGLLMDDAIVIAENIAAHLEKGKNAFNATVDGISEVAAGVFSSFLTTLFIFGALYFGMAGQIGKVLYVVPMILILTLSASLVEAFFILPNHLSHSLASRGKGVQKNRFRQAMDNGLNWGRQKILGPVVDGVVNFRYLFVGFVSLAGIVVNDSILLVSFIKLNVAKGKSVAEAGKLASRERFRAVLLTSLTTIAGLMPLLSERSLQAQILKPLACSIVFGLLMSTILVLLAVPCLYTILSDFNLAKSSPMDKS